MAFAVAALAAGGFLAANASATHPGANGRIAFVGEMPGCVHSYPVPPYGPPRYSAICTVGPTEGAKATHLVARQ